MRTTIAAVASLALALSFSAVAHAQEDRPALRVGEGGDVLVDPGGVFLLEFDEEALAFAER